jgi:hypothetical protein
MSLVWLGLMTVNIAGLKSKKENKAYDKSYAPKVLIILPCKGADLTLDSNIKSLKSQDYQNFMLIGVVDNDQDSAVQLLKDNMVDYIISKKICEDCSGKVRAISTALETYTCYDVYVIADSDVEAKKDWLSKLVMPLSDPAIGISTTFPLFKPKAGFWSKVKMVWGFVGDGMMESTLTRFGWGGSLAFRKDLLVGKAYDNFKHSISDDIAITTASKRKGLKINSVKERVAVINSDDDFKRFWEWSNRQTALSISGNGKVLYYGIVVYVSGILLLASAIIMSLLISYAYLLFLIPFVIGIAKTYKRAGNNASADLWFIYILTNFVYLANLITASRMKTITWRGNRYSIKDYLR